MARGSSGVWTVEVLQARGLLPADTQPAAEILPQSSQSATKHGNRGESYDGYWFDSQAEVRRYKFLRLSEKAGEIVSLRMHKDAAILLDEGFRDLTGYKWQAMTYEPDFRYTTVATGREVVEDVKGLQTDVFRIKMRMVIKRYPDILFLVLPAHDIDDMGHCTVDGTSRKTNKSTPTKRGKK